MRAIVINKENNKTVTYNNIVGHVAEKVSYINNETIHHITTVNNKELSFSTKSYIVAIQV